jgi:hypothetical protein
LFVEHSQLRQEHYRDTITGKESVMESQKRHRGYISTYVKFPNGYSGKVRVKDDDSSHNGIYLEVASFHDDFTPSTGINVDFLIATVTNRKKIDVLKAVDVRVISPPA